MSYFFLMKISKSLDNFQSCMVSKQIELFELEFINFLQKVGEGTDTNCLKWKETYSNMAGG